MEINFNKPYITGKEQDYIKDAIINRNKLSGDGYYTKAVSKFLEQKFGTKKALMMTSCSSALDMACLIIDIKEGDEVILPSFTFVSTANAVVLRGAKCVFVEVNEYLNIDLDEVESKITENTKAVMPVHYASTSCNMDRLMDMSKKYGFYVIEDAAQAVNAKYKDKYLGTIGHFGCYSFHETKNYVCGEGGTLLINTDDNDLILKAEIAREKGTNRSQFFRGEIDKYSWVGVGSSFLPSDMLAAFLLAQLENLEEINSLRGHVYTRYETELKPLEGKGYFRMPIVPSYNTINYHMFYLMFGSSNERDNIMKYLNENGVHAVFHYLPLHSSQMGLSMGYTQDDLSGTERISSTLLRLPIYAGMSDEEIEYIIKKIHEYYK